ncbi:MAG TPA: hypothetical protein DHW64_02490 [Chitinophagaceae bacterium]|jgi:hypothetical protein|nr:hypothetical protein [Chitinophagaceae bacterium]
MKKSIIFYGVFLLIAVIGIFYGNSISNQFENLRIWHFENIAFLLIGLPFIFLQERAGLPTIYNSEPSLSTKLFKPLLIGILFGVADLIVIELILNTTGHSSLPPYTQPFPYSLFLYSSGAFEIEVFYRLIPITLVLLIFSKIKNGAYQPQAFIAIAILTAIREPIEQFSAGAAWFVAYSLITGFGMNFLQAIYFRKYGWASSVYIRLGHYLIWHILNGVYIQYFVLQAHT